MDDSNFKEREQYVYELGISRHNNLIEQNNSRVWVFLAMIFQEVDDGLLLSYYLDMVDFIDIPNKKFVTHETPIISAPEYISGMYEHAILRSFAHIMLRVTENESIPDDGSFEQLLKMDLSSYIQHYNDNIGTMDD